jgi:surfeit locus 1 family protein
MSDSHPTVEKPDYARTPQPGAIRGGWRFRPRLLPTLAALVLLPTFISLGNWQMNKARNKGGTQSLLDARSREPAVMMPTVPAEAESLRYRRVNLTGRYETERQFLLDNRVHQERAGYHVLSPLRLAGSDMRVLVNRGWVPAPADHSQRPEIATPQGEVQITGVAVVPGSKFFTLAPEPAANGQWQPVWQNLDLARYRASVDFPVQPVVIQMDPDSAGGGFVREWPRPDERIERHLGYAWQWYGFAATLVAIWLVVNIRRA